jgi:hypothetical protein
MPPAAAPTTTSSRRPSLGRLLFLRAAAIAFIPRNRRAPVSGSLGEPRRHAMAEQPEPGDDERDDPDDFDDEDTGPGRAPGEEPDPFSDDDDAPTTIRPRVPGKKQEEP